MKKKSPSPAFDALIGPGGALEKAITAYESRPGQVEMAKAVWRTFSSKGVLLAEAGTGTGKSLAYLLPALLLDKRVIVSTGTKALQEQLARKDVPLCSKVLGREVKAVTVKGRANYLCLHYFARFLAEPLLRERGDARFFSRVARFAETTKTGDRAELEGVPDDLSFWHEISARGERCLGTCCPLYRDCFVVRLKREAEAAEIVITNHHLLFADRAVKSRAGDARVLPDYTHLVLDEAHDAESAATSFFGTTASRRMLGELLKDASKAAPKAPSLSAALLKAEQATQRYFEAWEEDGERKITLNERALPRNEAALRQRLLNLLDVAGHQLEAVGGTCEEALGLLERLDSWREAFLFALEESDSDYVRIAEVRGKNVLLSANPIDIAPVLKEHLWETVQSAVLTSATLCTGGSFDFLRRQLGLSDVTTKELRVQSPFDYPSQGLFYVPERFPQPSSPEFQEALCQEALGLVQASRGRAFVLCTSFKNMRAVAQCLQGTIPYPLLVQGDEPKGLLLEQFRKAGNAVLCATVSFWQGVDVQGEALSLVVLDKLPFGSPQDPLTQARIERLKKAGRDPFLEYQLPTAAILLQQGAGRLIRSKQDRGVVACLDVRLRQKSYGKFLLASLPDFQTTGDVEAVRAFFRARSL